MQGRHIVSWALVDILLFDIIASLIALQLTNPAQGRHPVLLQAKLKRPATGLFRSRESMFREAVAA
jgi:hypothetical protein